MTTLESGWDASVPGQNKSGLGEREVRTELTRGSGSLGPGKKQIQSKAPAPTQTSRAVLCSEASQRSVQASRHSGAHRCRAWKTEVGNWQGWPRKDKKKRSAQAYRLRRGGRKRQIITHSRDKLITLSYLAGVLRVLIN